MANRLFIKVTRENLPKVRDRYPVVYLEHGRLEVDGSSVKWIDATGSVIPLPVATISMLCLGPGTSVTHEAVKVLASSNCLVSWVGQDSLFFYAQGINPTSNTNNLMLQVRLAAREDTRLAIARKMFLYRFPKDDVVNKSLEQLMGMEGKRVKNFYLEMANKYQVGWNGRDYEPGQFHMSDVTNKILTASNAALYGIVTSVIHSLGFSARIGFIHSGSPLPFTYDIADLYKFDLCIEFAFRMTKEMGGVYKREVVRDEFIRNIVEKKFLEKFAKDVLNILNDKYDYIDCK